MDGSKDDAVRDDEMPYGVDTIRLRISFPAAPVPQGYNGRAWGMRPLRGWAGGAKRSGGHGGSVATGPDQAPTFPRGDQAVPVSQAVEGGDPLPNCWRRFAHSALLRSRGGGWRRMGPMPGTCRCRVSNLCLRVRASAPPRYGTGQGQQAAASLTRQAGTVTGQAVRRQRPSLPTSCARSCPMPAPRRTVTLMR